MVRVKEDLTRPVIKAGDKSRMVMAIRVQRSLKRMARKLAELRKEPKVLIA